MRPVADLTCFARPSLAVEAAAGAELLVVIGCGNLNRSDDGAGICVIRRLRQEFAGHLPANVRLFDAGTSGIEVMFQARGAAALIVIDACRSGSEPGAIFTLPADELGTRHEPSYSLHDFRWDHALYAGRRIFGTAFPDDLTAHLIEAGSLDLGLELTPPVAAAVETVGARIADRIRAHDAAFVRPDTR
jgi:hydrogenase maturation protease